MKRNTIRKRFAMVIAAVVTMAGVGSLQGSSEGGTRSLSYLIYDYNNATPITDGRYTLTLPEQTNTSSYTVFDPDTRVDYENSGVVKLNIGTGLGTGFIVGDHTIATAAHCIYNENTASYKTGSIRISLYDDEGVLKKTLTTANNTIQAHIPEYYVTLGANNFKYDYALITVSEDLSSYEHFELGEVLSSAANSTTIPVSVCGYSGGTLEIGEGRLKNIYDKYFTYDTDMLPGDSGGPVFVSTIYTVDTDIYYIDTVIGINTYEDTSFNQGNLMTPEMRQFYLNNSYNTFEE